MGWFRDIAEVFGFDNPATNTGERDAMIDHAIDKAETGKDPIPREPPDWAKDVPSPKDYGK